MKKDVNNRRNTIKENKISNVRITTMKSGMEKELIERYKYLKNKLKENKDDSNSRRRIIEMNVIKVKVYSYLYQGMSNKMSKSKEGSEKKNIFAHMINIVNHHYDNIFDNSSYCNNMCFDKYRDNTRITIMSKEMEEDLLRKYKLMSKEIMKKQCDINSKATILKMKYIKFLIYSDLYKDRNGHRGVIVRTINIINEHYNKLLDETLLSTNNNYNKISSFVCKTNDYYSDINKSFNNSNKEKNKLINQDKKISYNKINYEIDKNYIMNNKERKYDENQKKMKEIKRSRNDFLIDWFNKILKLNHDEFMIIEESEEFLDYYHDLYDNEIIEKINNKSIEACIQKQEKKKEEKKRLRNEFLIDWFNKILTLNHDEFIIIEESEEFSDYYDELEDDEIIKKIESKSLEVCYSIIEKEMCDDMCNADSNTIVEEIFNNNESNLNHIKIESEEELLIGYENKIEENIIIYLDNMHFTNNTNNNLPTYNNIYNNNESNLNHVKIKSEEELLIRCESKIEENIIIYLDNMHYTNNTNNNLPIYNNIYNNKERNLKSHIHITFIIIIIIILLLMIIIRITLNIKKHYHNINDIIKYNYKKLNYAKTYINDKKLNYAKIYINDNLDNSLLYNPTTSSEENILNELYRKLFKKPVRKIFDPGGLIKLIVLYCC
jgi:hypothetical protein